MRFAMDRRTGSGLRVHGVVRLDTRTKQLVKRLQPSEIAVIAHEDLDEVAADALITAKVKAVVNISASISGRYPNIGPLKLLRAGVVLIDRATPELFTAVPEGTHIDLIEGRIEANGALLGTGEVLDEQKVLQQMAQALLQVRVELEQFVENTLTYAQLEKEFFLGELPALPLQKRMEGRHVLVVVRGPSYKEDLRAITTYIHDLRPILIGVDGGADALLDMGVQPDLIVGDMDSVSDRALRCGSELIVHAYPDGRAPGLQRITALGLTAHTYPAPGTSEDVAMLLAHEQGAQLIVAVGTHSNMIDFLDKGRRGMSSTVLTRMRIGNKLVDAKGVSLLYRSTIDWRAACVVAGAALVPFAVLAWMNPGMHRILRMAVLHVKLLLF